MKDLLSSGPPQPSAAAFRPDPQGFLWLDPAGFVQYFAPDVDPAQARVLAAVQKPIAAGEILSEEKFGAPPWKSVPAWYLVTTNDQMIPPPAQQFMAQRMGATVSTVASSHVPMLSHPDVVANLIQTAAQKVSGGASPSGGLPATTGAMPGMPTTGRPGIAHLADIYGLLIGGLLLGGTVLLGGGWVLARRKV